MPVDRLDHRLIAGVVTQGFADKFHGAGNDRIRKMPALPDTLQNLILRDRPIRVFDKEHEKIEGFGFKVDWRQGIAIAKLSFARVEPIWT